ncbi:MAG TPA: AMIN domain-containing protein [Gemmatimonadales bacterium]|nr:AMIN domain-containing protein [Gemmatimonadales bacterium]
MTRIAALAASLVIVAAPPAAGARDGEVKAVSVTPAVGKVEVVIDLQGAAEVREFTLTGPYRLVVDLVGARLTGPAVAYDGENRGGVRNVRYAQYQPDVVRVVIDLEAPTDYEIVEEQGRVRIALGTDRAVFAAWTSDGAGALAGSARPPVAATATTVTTAAARVETPRQTDDRPSVDEYLAAHRAEAAQSQAPRITVNWDRASIEEVITGFAAFSGRTIMLGKGVSGTITAEIRNQPWDLAFNAVLESQGLAPQILPGGIINVQDKKVLAASDSTVPLETRLVRVNYANAGQLVTAVQSIVTKPRGAVVADSTSNSLVITDVATRINEVEQFVRGLDRRTPQVSIQAKIIFVDRTSVEEFGVKYDLGTPTQFYNRLIQRPDPANPGETFNANETVVDLGGNQLAAVGNAEARILNPALDLLFSTALGNFDLSVFVQALQRVELADIEAVPSVTTVDNRPAEILVGDRVPIRVVDASATGAGSNVPTATVRFEQTGINLRVTPHVTANRQVLMEVHAERSNVRLAPVDIGFTFQTQEADNQVLVADGETAVIGGLTVTELTVVKTGIPILVDLPLIGGLFGFKSTTENRRDLLILITPHIIDDLPDPGTGN